MFHFDEHVVCAWCVPPYVHWFIRPLNCRLFTFFMVSNTHSELYIRSSNQVLLSFETGLNEFNLT